MKKFKQKDIEKYLKVLKAKNNKATTINNKLAYLSKCLNYTGIKVVIPYQKTQKADKSVINKNDFRKMRLTMQKNKELYNFSCIAYYTGLRANEILNIRMQHIKKEGNNYFLNLYNTKNHQNNFIPITRKLNFIFKNFQEFTLNYKQIHYELKKLDVTAHQFRHTFITNCYEKGLDSFTIMKLTNQKSLSVHQRYVHLQNKMLTTQINKI
ncbi:MAG: tyrosine-type recombinase/integrase [Candidatus Gastranaerophilales bacterium]|nr:tyrosine-type recombinase/integrase [Candidatus Gastranaerophilales bacterium]